MLEGNLVTSRLASIGKVPKRMHEKIAHENHREGKPVVFVLLLSLRFFCMQGKECD